MGPCKRCAKAGYSTHILPGRCPPQEFAFATRSARDSKGTDFTHLLAGEQGFEPRYHDPESCVLPLDDSPKIAYQYIKFFVISK